MPHRRLALVALTALLSCSETSRPKAPPPSPGQLQAAQGAARCLDEGYRGFLAAATSLAAATEALAAAPASAEARSAAHEAWRAAAERWQELEPAHFGPAAPPTSPGGLALRDEIYSWPLISRCTVEQTLVSQAYQDAAFGSTSLVNARGLAALEYLLFYEGADNACGPQASINTGGSWAAIGPDELRARKAAYARIAAADVARRAQTLADAWAPGKGDFVAQVSSAGAGSKTFASAQQALNAVTDALVGQLDKDAKDRKLGRPLGLLDCTTATCPEALESRYARRSRAHLRANLVGARRVLLGCTPATDDDGLDVLLRTSGAADLASRLQAALDAAIAALDATPGDDLDTALAQNLDSVKAAHAALKAFTDLLRTEFLSVLDLELPPLVEGDND